jgi:hypothetical protein
MITRCWRSLREAQRGQQIRQRLACACSCLDDQVALVREGLLNCAGHLVLALAMLKLEARPRQHAARREELVQARKLRRRRMLRLGGGDLDGGGHEAAI